MAVRLQMKLGYLPEQSRLPDSPDTIRPHEPSVGAILRSKGSLYLLVTAPQGGHRLRDATRLVADTIENEYYYDESAGIRVCLQKAIRNANKRLGHSGDRFGVGHGREDSGPIGVAAAVVRGNELYVSTVGPAEAFLIRQARLSTLPDPHRERGLPTDTIEPDVWRGEIAVGDSLLLVSPNVVAKVGPEEIKDALVTLHPQSAMEHLHHRFVAADGEGSDGALAFEATEVATTVKQRTLVPVRPPEPLAGAPDRSPIPLADTVGDGVAAVSASALRARSAAGGAFGRIVRGFQDVLPKRNAQRRRITPAYSRFDTQRRAAVAILALVVVAVGLGVGVWYVGGSTTGPRQSLTAVEAALARIQDDLGRVSGPGVDLIRDDSAAATRLLTDAYQQLQIAQAANAPAAALAPYRSQILLGLDTLFKVKPVKSTVSFSFAGAKPPVDLSVLIRGPNGVPYVIDRAGKAVYRIDLKAKKATPVIHAGQAAGGTTAGEPRFLAVGGTRDLLILDSRNNLWRWRDANSKGNGTLTRIRPLDSAGWGNDIRGLGTFIRGSPDAGLYNIYIVDPSEKQLIFYTPAADGNGYPGTPSKRLATAQSVDDVDGMLIDGDIYFAQGGAIKRVVPASGWTPGDIGDSIIHPTTRFTAIATYDDRRTGVIYGYDAANGRIVAFDKDSGNYEAQFRLANGDPGWGDLRGFYVLPGTQNAPPTVVWIDGTRLSTAPLTPVVETVPGEASPSARPSPSSKPSPSVKPRRTPKPTR